MEQIKLFGAHNWLVRHLVCFCRVFSNGLLDC